MYFEIVAIAAVFIFAVLSFYSIRTLLSLQHTLRRIDILTIELDCKVRQLESTLKTISNIGDICELKTARLREEYLKKQEEASRSIECSDDIAEWLLASIRLGSKFIRRK